MSNRFTFCGTDEDHRIFATRTPSKSATVADFRPSPSARFDSLESIPPASIRAGKFSPSCPPANRKLTWLPGHFVRVDSRRTLLPRNDSGVAGTRVEFVTVMFLMRGRAGLISNNLLNVPGAQIGNCCRFRPRCPPTCRASSSPRTVWFGVALLESARGKVIFIVNASSPESGP